VERLAIDGPALVASAEGPVELRASADGLAIERLRLRARGLGAIEASGRVERGAVRGLALAIDGLDLGAPPPVLAAWLPADLGGTVDLWLSADGALPAPRLEGSLAWREARLRGAGVTAIDAEIAASGPGAVLRARASSGAGELLAAELRVPWNGTLDPSALLARPETRLDLRARDLDLEQLRAIWPALPADVGGRLELAATLAGGAPQPALSGQLRLSDVRFEAPFLGGRLGPLSARASLAGDELRIEEAALPGGDGRAVLTGRVLLRELAPAGAELRLAFSGFEVRRGSDFAGRLDGELAVEGPIEALSARGSLVLSGATVRLAQQRNPLFKEIRVRRIEEGPTGSIREEEWHLPPWADGASLAVGLAIPGDASLAGQGASIAFRGDLEARKRPFEDAHLVGAIESVKGSYRLYGRLFTLERGRVVFTGRRALDPELDVAATHRVRDVTVTAALGGTVSKPVLRLESDPPLPENDVVALLLFGRTREELAESQAAGLSFFLAQTAGGAALEQIGSAVPFLPVENTVLTASGEGDDATLGIGHYVTPDVYVQYDTAASGSEPSRLRLDWRLGRRWSVETRVASDGHSSADLIWTWDF
jgi:translocation and assembly module TamB